MTLLTYVLLAASLWARVVIFRMDEGAEDSVDATPLVILLSLLLAGIVHLEDPLSVYGLHVRSLAWCPWNAVFALWLTAFVAGRVVVNAMFLNPGKRSESASVHGTVNPGGVYLSLRRYPKCLGLILALPMTFSQAFMEEFIFRGLLVSLGKWIYSSVGMRPGQGNSLSIIGSSLLFGFIHFLPAVYSLKGKSTVIPFYALVIPTTLGIAFSVLNQVSSSLWPGWIVHFSLNYAGFAWDRISGRWERWGLS